MEKTIHAQGNVKPSSKEEIDKALTTQPRVDQKEVGNYTEHIENRPQQTSTLNVTPHLRVALVL